MKLAAGIAVVFCCLLGAVASAGDMRDIELTDGSVISGEIVSAGAGIYTIKSPSLGTIKVEESKIRAIRSKGLSSTPADANSQVKSLQDKMMNDGEIMDMIRSLQNDPEFQKVLEDPAIMKAVQSGDIAALMANPQFTKLLNNKTVQDIKEKVAR